jgi:GTP-binding protein
LIEITVEDPVSVYRALLQELKLFDSSLLDKPRLIAFTKIDLIPDKEEPVVLNSLKEEICIPISAVTGEGIDLLLKHIINQLSELNHET